jgi:hypothetical protein
MYWYQISSPIPQVTSQPADLYGGALRGGCWSLDGLEPLEDDGGPNWGPAKMEIYHQK